MEPRTLKWWLIAIAVLYLVMPRDLVFDFFGRGLGLVDDALVAWLLYRFYRQRQQVAAAAGASGSSQGTGHSDTKSDPKRDSQSKPPPRPQPADTPRTPHEVLGIPANASADEIQAAYRARMQEYHPDKVAHLGKDLQQLAHEKAQEITRAYRALKK